MGKKLKIKYEDRTWSRFYRVLLTELSDFKVIIMDKNMINAGFIVQLCVDDWRELKAQIKRKVDRLIFVKKCPVTVKLEIKENFPI